MDMREMRWILAMVSKSAGAKRNSGLEGRLAVVIHDSPVAAHRVFCHRCIPSDMAEGTEETHPLEHGKTLRFSRHASILSYEPYGSGGMSENEERRLFEGTLFSLCSDLLFS